MGYSENLGAGDSASRKVKLSIPIAVCMSISLYNVIELNALILMTFERRKSLYFWSFLAATNGIAPHTIGFLLKNVLYSDNFILYVTLISVGWVMMVTGQSLVLYSRLHLIFWNQFWLRLVLTMIVTNAVILHIPIIILMYGSNSSPSNPWVHPYMVYEKIQVTMFFLQEVIISAIYIKACSSFLGIQSALYGTGVRKIRRHLLLVNVIIILLDIPILVLEYADFYDFQTAYKAIVYSVKLKLEFNILNRLVKMANSNEISGLRSQGPDTDTAAGIHLNMFNGDAFSRNVSCRVYAHGGEHGDTTGWNTGGWRSMSDGIMRTTEITMDCVKRGEGNNENIERKLIGKGEHHYRTTNGMGGISKSSSELNLATRGF